MVGNTPDRSRLEETEKKAFFGHFRLCEVCTYLRTSIVNPFLRSFWGVNQLYTTGSSRDMENHGKPQKTKKSILGNFWLSEGYTYFSPLIINKVLQSFWLVNQLSTTCVLQDMDFWQFGDVWAQFWPKKLVSATFQLDHQINP